MMIGPLVGMGYKKGLPHHKINVSTWNEEFRKFMHRSWCTPLPQSSYLVLFEDKPVCLSDCKPALSPGSYLSFDPLALCLAEDFTIINLNKYVLSNTPWQSLAHSSCDFIFFWANYWLWHETFYTSSLDTRYIYMVLMRKLSIQIKTVFLQVNTHNSPLCYCLPWYILGPIE